MQTVVDYLDGTSSPPGLPPGAALPASVAGVHRDLTRPLEDDDLAAYAVGELNDPAELEDQSSATPTLARTLLLAVECRARATFGGAVATALDELATWAVQATLSDQTVGGLARSVELVREGWRREELAYPYGALTIELEIDYLHSLNDPESL